MGFWQNIFGYPADKLSLVNAETKKSEHGTAFIFNYRLGKARIKYIFLTKTNSPTEILNGAFSIKEIFEAQKGRLTQRVDMIQTQKGEHGFVDKYVYENASIRAQTGAEFAAFVENDKSFVGDNQHILDNEARSIIDKVASFCLTMKP